MTSELEHEPGGNELARELSGWRTRQIGRPIETGTERRRRTVDIGVDLDGRGIGLDLAARWSLIVTARGEQYDDEKRRAPHQYLTQTS